MDAAADAEFSDFMHGRWVQLVRLGYGLTGDRQLAEDLAQTAFARAYASWGRVRRADNPDAYLRRIVVNANAARFRKIRVGEVLTETVPDLVAAADGAEPAGRPGRAGERADAAAVRAASGGGPAVLAGPDGDRDRGDPRVLGRQREEPGVAGASEAADERGAPGRRTGVSIQDERELRDRLGSPAVRHRAGAAASRGHHATGSGDQDAPVDLGGGRDCGARSRGSRTARPAPRAPGSPVAPPHYKVIVSPIGAGAPPGLIGQGIDGRAPMDGCHGGDGRMP